MRIAVFIKRNTYHKGHGGLEVQNRLLCEGLFNIGYEIDVFSPKREFNKDKETLNGVNYYFIDSDFGNSLLSYFSNNSWFNKSLEVFRKAHNTNPYDLVLSQSSGGLSIIRNKNEFGIKVVTISHGTAISEFKTYITSNKISKVSDIYWMIRNLQYALRQFFIRQRNMILHSNKIIAVSNSVKESLIEETFVNEDKIVVIHNGVNPSIFHKIEGTMTDNNSNIDLGSNVLKLIFVGRVEESKGVLDLVSIVNELKDENINLVVVGDGPALSKMKSLVSELKLESKIDFKGKLDYSNVIDLLLSSDVFLFPTKRIEGFPMVIVEAMLAKLPVIGFNMGGVSDAIVDGETGYVIKSGDLQGFKDSIRKFIIDRSLSKKMGLSSYHKALNEFTLDKMIQSYNKVFMEVVK